MLMVLNVLLTIICFVLTIPLRSSIFILKANLKRMELKDNITKGKGFNPVRHITGRSKKALRSRPAYIAQKALIRGMKFLVFVLQTISRLGAIVFIVSVIIIAIVAFILIACLSSILVVVNNGELTFTVGELNSSKKKAKVVQAAGADVDGWLESCQIVWTHNRKKGYNYSQSSPTNDKDYGYIRLDCTGYVWQCLSEYGSVNKPNKSSSSIPYSANIADCIKKLKQWKVIKWSSNEKLEKGDILIRPKSLGNGHATIYAGNGQYFNNGNTSSSFQAREGKTEKGRYKFWEDSMTNGCYIARLKGGSSGGSVSDSRVIYPKKGDTTLPHMLQGSWSNVAMSKANGCTSDFVGKSISSSGCSFTSMAVICTKLTGKLVTPKDTLKKCGKAYVSGGFASWIGCKDGDNWVNWMGLTGYELKQVTSPEKAKEYSKKGYYLFTSVTKCKFTSGSHYIVVRTINDDWSCYVNDSSGYHNGKGSAISREDWLDTKFDFKEDIWNHLNSGMWVVKPK